MPLTRIVQGTFTAATAALFLLPSGAATASAPLPDAPPVSSREDAGRQDASRQDSASPDRAAPCRDTQQVGSTSHLRRNGEIIASVKHFYSPSCKRDYGYIWVWQSYVDKHPRFRACIGLWDATDGKLLGNHCREGARELWSYPVANKPGHHLETRGSVTEYKAIEYKTVPQGARN